MTPASVLPFSEKVSEQFLGRKEALQEFKKCLADTSEKGVYYYGPGGLGKTWILEKILENYSNNLEWLVSPIVDFYPTKHHSIRGLQQTLRQIFPEHESFAIYEATLRDINSAQEPGTSIHSNRITNLEIRANYQFIDSCIQASKDQKIILLFDTFERVQNQDVGHWLLHALLPALKNVRFALAGRPDPTLALPDYIEPHEVTGFDFDETITFLRQKDPEISKEIIRVIWERTGGVPLILNLIRDLTPEQLLTLVTTFNQSGEKRVQDSEALQMELINQFRPIEKVNMTLWAMASLWRRFDLPMLSYLSNRPEWARFANYEEIHAELGASPYIKEHAEAQSHLLHDEIQRMISKFILVEEQFQELFKPVYELIVQQYYPSAITSAREKAKSALDSVGRRAALDLWRQLRAEELGYILDQDRTAGLQKYEELRAEVQEQHDYALEELVWSEMRGYLDRMLDDEDELKFQIYEKRGELLRHHSLFQKAKSHYAQMVKKFPNWPTKTRLQHGFMLQRLGQFNEAEKVFVESLSLTPEDDLRTKAETVSALGQTARRAGRVDKAKEHYRVAIKAATDGRDYGQLASAYINRAYVLASEGEYEIAKQHCRWALDLLNQIEPEKKGRSEIYAYLNLGSSHRFGAEYEQAAQNYRVALKLSKVTRNEEALCEVLQNLGINAHYWGRKIRRDTLDLVERGAPLHPSDYQNRLDQISKYQSQAWENLTQALELAWRADWRGAMASTLHRLAKVYREIHRINELLEKLPRVPTSNQDGLNDLKVKAASYAIPMEAEYERRLMTSDSFDEQGTWIYRAVRLFDLAAWVADEVSDFHRSLDTLMELTRLFDELEEWDLMKQTWDRIEEVKGFDYQAELFTAVRDISKGNLAFDQGNFERALQQYTSAFTRLVNQSGYAKVLLKDSLRDVRWRFETQDAEQVLIWCDKLEEAWEPVLKDTDDWTALQSFLEDLRFRTIRRM